MECDKIFKDARARMVSKNSGGIFAWQEKAKGIKIRDFASDGHSGGQKTCEICAANYRPNSKNIHERSDSMDKGVVDKIRVEFCRSIFQYPLSSYCPKCSKWLDEFRSFLSADVNSIEISWEECEKNAKFQRSLYSSLDQHIIVINDIPKIPLEYEVEGKTKYYGIDTEDNSLGVPHFFQFATRDQVYIASSFRLLLRYILEKHGLNTRNHVVWGTNIEYELGNIFKDWKISKEYCDIKWTKGGVKKFELHYLPDSIPWANEKDFKGSFKVWDTMTHWKLSVKGMGKVLTDFLDYDFNKLTQDFYSFKYAAMDAIVSRSYACVQKKYYDSKGVKLKFTPGATALNFYMEAHAKNGDRLCKHKLYGSHTDDELRWLIEGFRGGRTEVFSLKEYYGKIGYFDINSAYPHAMKFGVFPHPHKHEWVYGHNNIDWHINTGYEGMILCEVDTSDTIDFVKHIPYLGTRDEDTLRYIFPLGKWKGKYTAFEIRKALIFGYKFKFKEAIMYEPSKLQPFGDFVDFCYDIRNEGTKKNDPMLRNIGKNLGNNLFGKFSQRINFTVLDDAENYKTEDINNCISIGDSILIEKDEGFAPHTNVIWAAHITAMCRDNLYEKMLNSTAKGNEVLYCDTDGLFLFGGKPPATHQTKLGALKLENYLTYFKAYLPKTYAYELKDGTRGYTAKGVPKKERERFLISGQVEYRKPMKIREALRRKDFGEKNKDLDLTPGVSAINAWITVTKELKGIYTKRQVLKNGLTTPLILT